jgi:hypothetical protein
MSCRRDLRLQDAVGQVGADLARHSIAHIVHRPVHRGSDVELDVGERSALLHEADTIDFTLPNPATAPSICWVTCVSSSVGAPPGWLTEHLNDRRRDIGFWP